MVKAIWAVACLLAVLLAAGCSNKQTVKPDGVESAPTVSVASPAPVQPASVSLPVAPIKGAEAAAGVDPSLLGPQYKMGPEDQIRVSVWENKELTLDLVVRPDGKISMPLIQDVMAEGATAAELAALIQRKLAGFIKDPQVSVIVLQVNAPKYFVIGNVAKPGTYSLRSETSILQALALAGGFTQFASPRSIKLIRNTGGKQGVRKINYYDVIDTGGEGNFLLKSGDTIVVP
jgi:polysaccharide biosynthesis/export protein